jgi:hypothetical protein
MNKLFSYFQGTIKIIIIFTVFVLTVSLVTPEPRKPEPVLSSYINQTLSDSLESSGIKEIRFDYKRNSSNISICANSNYSRDCYGETMIDIKDNALNKILYTSIRANLNKSGKWEVFVDDDIKKENSAIVKSFLNDTITELKITVDKLTAINDSWTLSPIELES